MTRLQKWILGGLAIFALAAGASFAAGPYYTAKGISQYKNGSFDEARTLLSRALKFSFRNSEAYYYLAKVALGKTDTKSDATLLYPQADYPQAISNFEKAIRSGLDRKSASLYADGLASLGFSYWMIGEYEKADATFRQKIAADPQHASFSRYLLATDDFERANKPSEALQVLEPVFADGAFPPVRIENMYRVRTLMSRLYYYAGDNAKAGAKAQEAVSTAFGRKDYPVQVAHLILAQVYGAEKQYAQMKKEIDAANALAGSTSMHNCVLGKGYFDGGEYRKAIDSIRPLLTAQTAKQVPYGYSICLNTMARTLEKTGDAKGARDYYSQYLHFTDSFKEKNIFVSRDRQLAQDKLASLE